MKERERQRRRDSDAADARERRRNKKGDATEIRYDREADVYELRLRTGTRLAVPRKLLAHLPADAPPEALSDVELEPMGTSVWWETLDTGYHLDTLIEAALGGAYRLVGTPG